MKVKALVWIGTRTEKFGEMLDFCQNVLGLKPAVVKPGFAALDMPNGDRFEIFGVERPNVKFYTHPVAAFLVDDIAAARVEMEAYGIEFIDPIHTEEDGSAWTHFRAPDGFVYSLNYIPGHPDN